MADGPVSVREKKFIRNPLLSRKQFILEVVHPGKANLSRTEIAAQLSKVCCGHVLPRVIENARLLTLAVLPLYLLEAQGVRREVHRPQGIPHTVRWRPIPWLRVHL
jgi:hypothetical protein